MYYHRSFRTKSKTGDGNILTVNDGVNTTSYVYDKQNQLVRENNQTGNFTHTWQYDNAGNIQTRTEYAYTTGTLGTPTDTVTYTYADESWGDLLTAYDGAAITYDGIGNPNALDGWSFTWEHGRELATMSNGTTTWTNTYNADGLRTKRTNGSTTYSYVYTGSSLLSMTVGSNTLYFNYDAAGTPLTVTYNGTTYYYATNLQGDVVAILDSTGATVVSYTYDAWGNPISTTGSLATTLGQYNPLRYRGYVYDTETGLYYLQTRYYNPEICRFLNADGYTSTGQSFSGNNTFVYCGNNSVVFSDYYGNRHCAAASVSGESKDDRKTSCAWQKQALLSEKKQTPLDEWEDEGVEFIPSGSGDGGRIVNSYLITDIDDMKAIARYLMFESEYSSYFSGSIEGFVYEWEVHNFAYQVFSKMGNVNKTNSAKDVDIGRTIYDDNHGVFTEIMLTTFKINYPDQARADLEIYESLGR